MVPAHDAPGRSTADKSQRARSRDKREMVGNPRCDHSPRPRLFWLTRRRRGNNGSQRELDGPRANSRPGGASSNRTRPRRSCVWISSSDSGNPTAKPDATTCVVVAPRSSTPSYRRASCSWRGKVKRQSYCHDCVCVCALLAESFATRSTASTHATGTTHARHGTTVRADRLGIWTIRSGRVCQNWFPVRPINCGSQTSSSRIVQRPTRRSLRGAFLSFSHRSLRVLRLGRLFQR